MNSKPTPKPGKGRVSYGSRLEAHVTVSIAVEVNSIRTNNKTLPGSQRTEKEWQDYTRMDQKLPGFGSTEGRNSGAYQEQ